MPQGLVTRILRARGVRFPTVWGDVIGCCWHDDAAGYDWCCARETSVFARDARKKNASPPDFVRIPARRHAAIRRGHRRMRGCLLFATHRPSLAEAASVGLVSVRDKTR